MTEQEQAEATRQSVDRGDLGNTSVYQVTLDRPYLLAGFTTRAEHQQSRPLASGAPRTATDHSNVILPMTEIGSIFGIGSFIDSGCQYSLC